MALNISTLTNPATSGDVLQEVTTTADFLESVPVLRNLSRGSNKGGDAKQSVSLNQPRALPLIKNPQGNLGGYLYIPDVNGNYATGPSVTIGANQTWEGELDMVVTQWGGVASKYVLPMGGGDWANGFGLILYPNGDVRLFSKGAYGNQQPSGVTLGTPFNVKYGNNGTNLYVNIDDVNVFTDQGVVNQAASITHTLELAQTTLTKQGNYAIQKAKLTVNSAVVFDCDFNGSTSIRHGDTKFQAAVGGPVTITQSGNDPATIIKKPVLRFDGTNDGLRGLFANNINSGYMFAAFSVLGDGGESYGRVFSTNLSTSGNDFSGAGTSFSIRYSDTLNLSSLADATINQEVGLFDDANGDILHVVKIKSGEQTSSVNNAALLTNNRTTSTNSDEFNIGFENNTGSSACIDLQFLGFFPETLTTDQAADVVNYINNRNNVFDLKDGFGYYFYDAQSAPVGAITTGSASWNGRIVGSDNGDTDRYLTQGTTNDAPVGNGYTVTFADNTDHLDIPSTAQAGWQIVGTSLGTFAYRVNNTAVTELNLLGNFGHANTRQTGDLYGIILLPESATSADIESARKILIDRGSSDALSATVLYTFWYQRADIVDFKNINMSSAVNVQNTWDGCSNMVKFEVTDISNGNNFSNAWKNCSALTSFPSGAKLGTSSSNVNFTSAWRSSGLTSFSTPLPTATNVSLAWLDCTSLTSFNVPLPLATNVNGTWYNCSSLTNFSSDLSSATNPSFAFYNCTSLSSFNTPLPLAVNMNGTWLNCSSLTDFSVSVFANWNPSSIASGVFNDTWDGCNLTAQSVENILTSIDASGKHGTATGASGGGSIDSGIDIDYNGDPLSAATDSAITSLRGKSWVVYINGVERIP